MSRNYNCDIIWKKMVFEDIIRLRILRRDHPRFRVGPKSDDGWSYKRKEERDLEHKHIGEKTKIKRQLLES